jgi:hypothetical protein
LLPFLRSTFRRQANAISCLGFGMVAGAVAVASATIVERALFVGLFDFSSDYRVVGPFSSMHLGGGHIGAYLAMTLPFVAVFVGTRGLWVRILGLLAACGVVYALLVTYARSAYVAAFAGVVILCLGWASATYANRRRARAFLVPALAILTIGGIIAGTAFSTDYMRSRLATIAGDLGTREGNWSGGLAVRDSGIFATLFGMGLGTYPRLYAARATGEIVGTDFTVREDAERSYLSMRSASPLYFGQKLPPIDGGGYELSLDLRALGGKGELDALLCEKVLLYSTNCRSTQLRPPADGSWASVAVLLPTDGFNEPRLFGWLRRPAELGFSGSAGSIVDFTRVQLIDPSGHDVIVNGDFLTGTDRWYFTDDNHLSWRIKNQYLMTFFEQGVVGLVAFLVLPLAALARLVREIRAGNPAAAMIAGSIVAFLCSGLFDYLLEAPRLASLFYLVCFAALSLAGDDETPKPTTALPPLGPCS